MDEDRNGNVTIGRAKSKWTKKKNSKTIELKIEPFIYKTSKCPFFKFALTRKKLGIRYLFFRNSFFILISDNGIYMARLAS